MKTLLIMRHAKSSWDSSHLADHDRPLNDRGLSDAPAIGAVLNRRDLIPELIITSTAERARQTAQLVADNSGFDGRIVITRDLYHAGVDEFIDGLRTLPRGEDVVLVVAHNPGVAELVDFLTDVAETLTTANVAVIQLPIDEWTDLDFETEGNLVEVLRPRDPDV